MKDAKPASAPDLAALKAENSALRDEVANLRSRLTALLRTPADDSVTRVFRLVSEKNELASQLTERVADLSSRLSILEDSHASISSELERARKLTGVFRQIVEAISLPIVCADMEGRVNYANSSSRSLFPEVRNGDPVDIGDLTYNGTKIGLERLIIRVIASPNGKLTHQFKTAARKKGTVQAVALHVEGRAIGVVLVFDL